MSAIHYCRRKKYAAPTDPDEAGQWCGRGIEVSNALGWCEPCRSSLPLWPAGIDSEGAPRYNQAVVKETT